MSGKQNSKIIDQTKVIKFEKFSLGIENFDAVFDAGFNFEIGFGIRASKVSFLVALRSGTRFKNNPKKEQPKPKYNQKPKPEG